MYIYIYIYVLYICKYKLVLIETIFQTNVSI